MYDYDDFTLTIEDAGDVYINEPGRRKRKIGQVKSKKVLEYLRETDLALVERWSYVDASLGKLGLRSAITLFGVRSSSDPDAIFRSPAKFEVVAAFTLDRAWARKRWGVGDWDLIAKELVNRLEEDIPLSKGRQTHHQELEQRWLFSVPLWNQDETEAFLDVMEEMTTQFPVLLNSLGLKA